MLCGLLLSPIAGLAARGAYSGGIEKRLVLAATVVALRRLAQRPSVAR